MELQEIQQFIESNKGNEEVQNYIKGFVTEDGVNSFLETEAGKKILQPKLDKYHAKGLDTWQKNNLQKLIDEEVSKRYPAETEEQKQLRQLQDQINKMQQEKLHEELKNKAFTVASDKKLPVSIVELLIGKDAESTISNINKLEEVFGQHIQTRVDERLNSNSTTIAGTKQTQPTSFTEESISKMTQEEFQKNYTAIMEFYKSQSK